MCLGTVTSKSGRHAVQPLRSKGGGSLTGLCYSVVYEVLVLRFFCVFFTRNDALGTVCSLLRPACNSGFDRDEENANLV